MNVEAITVIDSNDASSRSGDGSGDAGEFSGVLRSALGEGEGVESSSEDSEPTPDREESRDGQRDPEAAEAESASAEGEGEGGQTPSEENGAEAGEGVAAEGQAAEGYVPEVLAGVRREVDPGQAAVENQAAATQEGAVRDRIGIAGERGAEAPADDAVASKPGQPSLVDEVAKAGLEAEQSATKSEEIGVRDSEERAPARTSSAAVAAVVEGATPEQVATASTEVEAAEGALAQSASNGSALPGALEEAPVRAEEVASRSAGENLDGDSSGTDREDQPESRDDDAPRSLADAGAGSGDPAESAAAAAAYAVAAETAAPAEVPSVNEASAAISAPGALAAPETASAPTAPTANAPQPAAASDAIAVQTEWLATRGGGSARLTLSPAELGEIEIRVTVRGGVVDVVMVAQEALTQAVAEEQSERLAQAFANRDLRMENFDVRRGAAEGAPNDPNNEFAQSSSQDGRGGDREGQRASDQSEVTGQSGLGPADRSAIPPRVLVTGPEASVDLRA